VELLVALAVLAVLLAGLAGVLQASLLGFGAVREGLNAQRTLRWAARGLDGELDRIGFIFPPPWLRPLPLPGADASELQSAFRLEPNRPLGRIRAGRWVPLRPGDDPMAAPGRTSDWLSFVADRPLAGGTLAAPVPGPVAGGRAWLSLALDRSCALRAGDLLYLEGERFQCLRLLEPAELRAGVAGTVVVGPARAGTDQAGPARVGPDQAGPARTGRALVRPAPAGAWVGLVRPLRAVALTVVYLDLPAAPGPVPCLVRLETDCRPDQTVPAWGEWLDDMAILAENVTGLRVDLSLDGRWPGIRGADAPETLDRLDRALRAGPVPAVNLADPLWFRQVPALLSLELEVRSPGPPVRHDRLRWLHRPRAFGLERS
jgi:hypothetical protein